MIFCPILSGAKTALPRAWHSMVQWNEDSIMTLGGFANDLQTLSSADWSNVRTKTSSIAPQLMLPHSHFRTISLPKRSASVGITRHTVLAISGFTSPNTLTSLVEILERVETIRPPAEPPRLASAEKDCDTFTATFSVIAPDSITRVWLDSATTRNVVMTVVERSAALLRVRLMLPIGVSNGFFTLIVESSSGMQRVVRETLRRAPNPLTVERQAGAFQFAVLRSDSSSGGRGDTVCSVVLQVDSTTSITCATFTLRNTSAASVPVPALRLARNTAFSMPPSQFPLMLAPFAQARIRLCFAPSVLGTFRDTLIVQPSPVQTPEQCFEHELLPLIGTRIPLDAELLTRCNAPVRVSTFSFPTSVMGSVLGDGGALAIHSIRSIIVEKNSHRTVMMHVAPPHPQPASRDASGINVAFALTMHIHGSQNGLQDGSQNNSQNLSLADSLTALPELSISVLLRDVLGRTVAVGTLAQQTHIVEQSTIQQNSTQQAIQQTAYLPTEHVQPGTYILTAIVNGRGCRFPSSCSEARAVKYMMEWMPVSCVAQRNFAFLQPLMFSSLFSDLFSTRFPASVFVANVIFFPFG